MTPPGAEPDPELFDPRPEISAWLRENDPELYRAWRRVLAMHAEGIERWTIAGFWAGVDLMRRLKADQNQLEDDESKWKLGGPDAGP
jgi:hypothetical protein